MSDYREDTRIEINKYFLRKNGYTVVGQVRHEPDASCKYVAKRVTKDMTYFLEMQEYDCKVVLIMYPMMVCQAPYRDMCLAYLREYNETIDDGEIDIDEKGTVFYRISKSYTDHIITEHDIYRMECTGHFYLSNRRDELERVTHGLLPKYFTVYQEGDDKEGFFEQMSADYMYEKTRKDIADAKARLEMEKTEKVESDEEEILTLDEFEEWMAQEEARSEE